MRIIGFLLAGITAYSADLIYLSDDPSSKNLESLNAKYQQTFVMMLLTLLMETTITKREFI